MRARSGPYPFDASMAYMLSFLRALFRVLPPLELPLDEPLGGHVVVYTDACYDADGFSGLGVAILDTESGETFESSSPVPGWVLDWLLPRGQQINHLEALAMVAARFTFPDVLRGRRVLHFVDNTVALSKAVHGYANAPDMAACVNALHLADASLLCDAWFEWVPSKANLSDLPSRLPSTWSADDAEVMREFRARYSERRLARRPLQLPSRSELDEPERLLARVRLL